jgi:hypothetical protein
MRRRLRPRLYRLAAPALLALILVATAVAATAPTVTLRLAGVHPKKRTLCRGDSHSIPLPVSQIRRNVPVSLTGAVRPAPAAAAWRATVVVKRCVRGDYKQVWEGVASGKSTGVFRASYTPRLPGLYFARAKYGLSSVKSNKLYFSAT